MTCHRVSPLPGCFAWFALCAVVGCGSTSPATSTGTINGVALAPQDAISTQSGTSGVVRVTSFAGACGAEGAHTPEPNGVSLWLQFLQNGPVGQTILSPGVQTFGHGLFSAQFESKCGFVDLTQGSVTLTKVDATALTGTFSFTFGGESLSGSFTAADCTALAAGGTDGGATMCNP